MLLPSSSSLVVLPSVSLWTAAKRWFAEPRWRSHQTFRGRYSGQTPQTQKNLYSWFNYSPLSVICPPLTPPRSQSNISHARPHRYLCKGTSGHFERITKSIVYKRPPLTFSETRPPFWSQIKVVNIDNQGKLIACFFFFHFPIKHVWFDYFKYWKKRNSRSKVF